MTPDLRLPSTANLFQECFETVEALTGLRTVIYDQQRFTERGAGTAIDRSFAGHHSDFCTLIRTTNAGKECCNKSDVEGATAEAGHRGQPFLHLCHAGLIELVMPLIYRGEHVATVFLGQGIVDDCPAADAGWVSRRATELGIDADNAVAASRALPRIDREKLIRSGKVLFFALGRLAETESRAALERALALERNEAIRRAVAYIDEHFTDAIRVDDLAGRLNFTPAYFSRLFHRVMGMTFVDYLTQRRVAEAKELLRSTSLNMTDIAFAVGYSHQSYFGRKFKQVAGQTPSAFRKANQFL